MNQSDIESTSCFSEERSSLQPAFAQLLSSGMDHLPMPGSGRTLTRWARLADVAERDLVLVKLFEGHTDALAILAELGADAPPNGSRWGTWCAEPPNARLSFATASPTSAGKEILISGTKSWCSGARLVTHAVVSGWNQAGEPCLATVAIDQPGVQVTVEGWEAVGMRGTESVDVKFGNARGTLLGLPGDYTARAGFWHGGAGIAACWYGGARAIASMTYSLSKGSQDCHRNAHLGAIDVAMASAAALLRETAALIDANPVANAMADALRARLGIEAAAQTIMLHAGRAVGAGPMCRDRRFARAMADLPVFIRQSHAERDLAALGSNRNGEAEEGRQAAWAL